jgi:threonine synthase
LPVTRLTHLECARCGSRHDSEELHNRCECGGTLLARYDLSKLDLIAVRARPPGMWRYRELLPVRSDPVCLGEVQTPLLFSARLTGRWGVETYLKDDSPMPGGTFKARGASVGLSRALELGAHSFVMPSAGNAGAAWSLYAARAGVSITVTMARTAPAVNHAEVRAAGGELVLVDGSMADASRRAAELAAEKGFFLAATFSEPYRLEGKKAAWLEVFDQLGDAARMGVPRTILLPVGGGVGALAAAKAAEEVRAAGWTEDGPPTIVGVQAAACAPIARAFERGDLDVAPWDDPPDTVAAGLRVPAPSEGTEVLAAVRAGGGQMIAVDDDEIIGAMGDLASSEGLLACPEGAAAVAAGYRLAAAGALEGPVVVYNTGTGAKYPDVLAAAFGA